ncbi:MAG: DNA mismatch repair protein MutS, partial [Clostridia bacterium]
INKKKAIIAIESILRIDSNISVNKLVIESIKEIDNIKLTDKRELILSDVDIRKIVEKSESIDEIYLNISIEKFIEETSLRDLNDFLVRINPAEIICNKEAKESYIELSAYKMDALPKPFEYYDLAFENQKATANIKRQFGNSAILIYELSNDLFSIASSGALLEYLIETQKRGLSHISKIKKIINNDFMILDLNTRRNLEITETIRDRKKKGSLLWLLDQTKTSMGARLFKNWLDEPLKNAEKINLRLDAVEEIVNSYELKENLTKILANINDIERLCGKIAFGSINPKECRALCSSLEQIPDLKDALKFATSSKLHSFYDNIADFSAVQKELDNAIIIDPPFLLKDGGYINENYNSLLKDYRHAGTEGKKWLAEIEAREKEKTGIKNLKIGFNKVFGYYAEINKSQIENVPLNYQRKQTVANNERYIFEDLKIVEEKILGAEDNAIKLEQEIFSNLREGLLKIIPSLQTLSKIISEIDCLFSLAVCALKNNYVKPKVSSKISHIKIEDGRHPVVEAIMKDNSFIPNDTYLNTTSDKIMVITGPNMAGKSTFMRQVAVLTFMAHIGSFVPAKSAEFSVTDRIFTRVGASDDLAFGQSTFMVEMTEVALILANATKDSLIILDEIGRGTSTFDGLSIAWAVIEYISNHFEAKTLFATHYHELTELEGLLNGVKNYRISIKEFNNSIIFLRKIVRGGANRSFGIEVASLAGLPKCV